ncbi:MAG: hypothetical protein IJ493_05020 [Clostridia bacterium]|nr:hypothetical protein [Clostridia bacterium]
MSTVNGKYMMYRGKPLVREGQQLCYGNMNDKYVLVLGIMSTKKVGNKELPDQIMIMIQRTGEDKTVVKSGIKNGLQEAFDYGIIWLETELAKK